jgi:hypothetical protein
MTTVRLDARSARQLRAIQRRHGLRSIMATVAHAIEAADRADRER